MYKILGISASLRNRRLGLGREKLVEEIKSLKTKDDLYKFIDDQVKITVDKLALDKIKKNPSLQGLSNSEAAIVVALWAAHQEGAEIDYISLADFFPPNGKFHKEDVLKKVICESDGIILSGPVYFGDRGSLAQSFIEYCSADQEIKTALKGKVYAGLAVGAKRNGGQETTLIYQMLDMINLNCLAVGNDSETSAQYGGTAVAGDIGTFSKDDYGFDTCLGTGRRVANVLNLFNLQDKSPTVHLWLLQDNTNRVGLSLFNSWIEQMQEKFPTAKFKLWDIAGADITRCIACDICPIAKGIPEDYRCIIKNEEDFFVSNHTELIEADAILLCAYSPEDRSTVVTQYQTFMERTRYLRRDDYLFTNAVVAPFVISEMFARQNLHMRMMTSAIRHNTIMHRPLIGMIYDKQVIGWTNLLELGSSFLSTASKLVKARSNTTYNPIGYVISKLVT